MDLPKNIGRYEIVGELGKGAMGTVYRALDPNIGRTVALKTMRIDVHGADEAEILRRFKHEAKLAGVLNHSNIVTIFDAGEFEGVFYMAMEFLEGETLQSLLHNHRTVPLERVIEYSRQICAGLDYAGSHGIVHRDVKPANIMITQQGVVKIMDFGIAKSAASMTTAGQVLGTPTYMSPEQVRGKTLDGRSDLFSFGVVLYEMVVGEKPFTGQTITTIIYKIINEPAIPPRELDVTIHPGISNIIMKSLAKSPDERYQTGAALVRDLQNYKSYGSQAEATKELEAASATTTSMSAVPSPPKAAAVVTAKVDTPAPPGPTLKKAAEVAAASATSTPAKPAPAKTAPTKLPHSGTGESTVGVGIRIGNKPMRVPVKALDKNKRLLPIAGAGIAILIALAIIFKPFGKNEVEPPAAVPAAVQSESVPADAKIKPSGSSASSKSSVAPVSTSTQKVAETKKPEPTKAEPHATAKVNEAVQVASDMGSLQVTSTPLGAKVVISGATPSNGTTPYTAANLVPGNYEVTLSKSGFTSQKRNVRVVAGRSVGLGADLVAEVPAKLTVTSTPPGAEITLNGDDTGKVTPATFSLGKGEHKVELHKSGFDDIAVTARVKEGENHTIAPVLQAEKPGSGNPFRAFRGLFGNRIPEGKGMISLESNPAGADVYQNGKKSPKGTPLKWPMDPGTYRITLRMDGYKAANREITVVKGKTTDVNVQLERR